MWTLTEFYAKGRPEGRPFLRVLYHRQIPACAAGRRVGQAVAYQIVVSIQKGIQIPPLHQQQAFYLRAAGRVACPLDRCIEAINPRCEVQLVSGDGAGERDFALATAFGRVGVFHQPVSRFDERLLGFIDVSDEALLVWCGGACQRRLVRVLAGQLWRCTAAEGGGAGEDGGGEEG